MSNNTNNNRGSQSQSWYSVGAWGLAAAAAIGGTAYLLSGSSKKEKQQSSSSPSSDPPSGTNSDRSASSYLSDMVARVTLDSRSNGTSCSRSNISQNSSVASSPVITNLNSLLSDIYVRFLKLKAFDFHYKVFNSIFHDLHEKMKNVDDYYRKYSSTVQYAGSHYDKLRIKKPDEFDMDVVIRLPLNIKPDPLDPNASDIILEPKFAGFIQLKMGKQFLQLPMRDKEEWFNNKAAFEWKDNCNYLLRSKFIQWFESVINRALNQYKSRNNNGSIVYVDNIPYTVKVRGKFGPAVTLCIRDMSNNFKMDVDLVPALKFPEDRWPISRAYRPIPLNCRKGYWTVVPKPNKDSVVVQDEIRSWRVALHIQERELMYDSYNLKMTIKLMKALRDAQEMDKIASYYIKTLFFWEIVEINDEKFWRNSPAVLFKRMVGKLHQALVDGQIIYFWNKNNNLIGKVPKHILNQYAKKLEPLMAILEDASKYKMVAKYLLNDNEFKEYAKILHI